MGAGVLDINYMTLVVLIFSSCGAKKGGADREAVLFSENSNLKIVS